MLKATWKKHVLNFRFDARTSRGGMKQHVVYYVFLWHTENPGVVGVGEAAPLPGLSIDARPDFETYLSKFTQNLQNWDDGDLAHFPSIKFALEAAIADLQNGGVRKIFDTPFHLGRQSIPINGLVWMGDKETMLAEAKKKMELGFTTIKLKVGAIDFAEELEIIRCVRQQQSTKSLAIRLDANGAWTPDEAMKKLEMLAAYHIESIEQPIKQGQRQAMYQLCRQSPIPIALDEELIGIIYETDKKELLQAIQPQAIVLKPTLIGGLKSAQTWIELAEKAGIQWWITSALESNIGLNAICQLTSVYSTNMPQGLGTGSLYTQNWPSPLTVKNGTIYSDNQQEWARPQELFTLF